MEKSKLFERIYKRILMTRCEHRAEKCVCRDDKKIVVTDNASFERSLLLILLLLISFWSFTKTMQLFSFVQLFLSSSLVALPFFLESTIIQNGQPSSSIEKIEEANSKTAICFEQKDNPAYTNQLEALSSSQESPSKGLSSCKAFTGKINKNRVRMRTQAHLDSSIIKELMKDDLLEVVGEQDDFFVVNPPKNMKGYVFRTYILDGLVEGNHVNVRADPDTQGLVLTQLNSGDKVTGIVCQEKSKWFEINLPKNVHFYVSKEFVQNIGDLQFFAVLENRKITCEKLLDELDKKIQLELQKPFNQIDLSLTIEKLLDILSKNQDLPLQSQKAKELLQRLQEAYLQKGVREEKFQKTERNISLVTPDTHKDYSSTKIDQATLANATYENRADELKETALTPQEVHCTTRNQSIIWQEREEFLFALAQQNGIAATKEDFYADQLRHSEVLSGKLAIYDKRIPNKPGEYTLIDTTTNLPIAFLYSTLVDLQPLAGKKINLSVSSRQNYHFALKAYFVLEAKETP